jgi:hypothetical protein
VEQKTQIHFDLLSNARDSIPQTVDLLAWPEESESVRAEHSRLKRAIMFSAHSIELLLKEKLRQVNPAFVWENADKYPSLGARTVTVDTAISLAAEHLRTIILNPAKAGMPVGDLMNIIFAGGKELTPTENAPMY